MVQPIVYACTKCSKPTDRDLLTVKKVNYHEMGAGGRTIRSRVVGWLCPSCVAGDDEWNMPKFRQPERLPFDQPVGTLIDD